MNAVNIWFYTFSTIAQVMAAIVGLFAVFVVYKIQDFSQDLNLRSRRMLDLLPYISANVKSENYKQIYRENVRNMSDHERLREFQTLLQLRNYIDITDSDFNDEDYILYENLVNLRRDILLDLREVINLGFGTIAISLMALVGTDILQKNSYLFTLILWMSLGLFLICLFAISKGIYRVATR